MHKITNLPTGVVGTADTNPHNEKSTYKAPKVTTVKFKVEVGLGGSVAKVKTWGSDWSNDAGYATEAYDNNTTQGSNFFGSAISGE